MSWITKPTILGSAFARLARHLLAHRFAWAMCLALVLASAIVGLTRLSIEFSASTFFASDDLAVARLQGFKNRWGSDDGDLLILVTTSKGNLLTRARIEQLSELTRQLAGLPGVSFVTALPDLPLRCATGGSEGQRWSTLHTSFVRDAGLNARPFQEWQRCLLKSAWVSGLLSRDGDTSVIVATLAPEYADDVLTTRATVNSARKLLAQADGIADLHFVAAGIPALRGDAVDLLWTDQCFLIPAVLAGISVLLGLLLPRPIGLVVPLAAAIMPTILLLGLMGWTGIPIGVLNQVYFTLLPALAVADAIHFTQRYGEELRGVVSRTDTPARAAAIERTLSSLGGPCLLAGATTALGFLSLLVTHLPVLRQFGLYAAIGLGLANVCNIDRKSVV